MVTLQPVRIFRVRRLGAALPCLNVARAFMPAIVGSCLVQWLSTNACCGALHKMSAIPLALAVQRSEGTAPYLELKIDD